MKVIGAKEFGNHKEFSELKYLMVDGIHNNTSDAGVERVHSLRLSDIVDGYGFKMVKLISLDIPPVAVSKGDMVAVVETRAASNTAYNIEAASLVNKTTRRAYLDRD